MQQENTAKSIHILPRALIVNKADLLRVKAAPLPVHIAAERQVVIQIVFVVHHQKVLVVRQEEIICPVNIQMQQYQTLTRVIVVTEDALLQLVYSVIN